MVCCFSVLIKGCLRAKCCADSIPFFLGCLGVVCCFSVLIKGCLRAKCRADSIPFFLGCLGVVCCFGVLFNLFTAMMSFENGP